MTLRQHPDLAVAPLPIKSIGAGGIVKHAHLPAYTMCGWQVVSVYDIDNQRAHDLAQEHGIDHVASTVEEIVNTGPQDCVYDLAVPAKATAEVLRQLPDEALVLMQKPMGEDFTQAQEIHEVCLTKRLRAAVNFQLRSAPYSLAARDALSQGLLGDLVEVDIKVHVHTPWAIWSFLELSPRMEIVYHSIHYLDLIRALLGEPQWVKATTHKHPASPKLHSSRSAVLMDFGTSPQGNQVRAQVVTYHAHDYGLKHQTSRIALEGTKGAVHFQMGLNMDYPTGAPDWLEINTGEGWQNIPLEGSWFPHAFRGPMAAMMRWAADPSAKPDTHFEDAFRTMAMVEAAYEDAATPGVDPRRYWPSP